MGGGRIGAATREVVEDVVVVDRDDDVEALRVIKGLDPGGGRGKAGYVVGGVGGLDLVSGGVGRGEWMVVAILVGRDQDKIVGKVCRCGGAWLWQTPNLIRFESRSLLPVERMSCQILGRRVDPFALSGEDCCLLIGLLTLWSSMRFVFSYNSLL